MYSLVYKNNVKSQHKYNNYYNRIFITINVYTDKYLNILE